ncbi:hypothetical protein CEUSTIGMA_g10980.t1 [Chlamydomonas eustigma]|uniref:ENTH domain-containing protein n=1 Tax=Chlamydomonas eustigma TaxID=1157962 RepID=A0A250XKE2_9CHLO|nr:hypothetical protein CEUSTIGMA_g10980.t1 [Chlamydomonas eustigma]|eukprot:GAX83555.1 hypothetical protein CEUSTIGMA_g10980.t1 [Chlamydomonas eustigma]
MLEAVQRYRAVENATSSTDDAPPVYLMDELAEMANCSPDQAEAIAEHVTKRLQNRSPIVKWKALRLIRHMCNKGCYKFQKCMQAYVATIRDLLHFKGEKDPFKGDSLNQRVRDSAKEVMEALYSSYQQQPANKPVPSSTSTGRMEGFGNTAYSQQSYNVPPNNGAGVKSGGGFSSAASSGRMVGFGNDGRYAQSLNSSGSQLVGADLTSTVTSAVGSIGGMILSQFSSNARDQATALHQRTGSHDEGNGYSDFSNRSSQPSSLLGSGRVAGSFGPATSNSSGSGGRGSGLSDPHTMSSLSGSASQQQLSQQQASRSDGLRNMNNSRLGTTAGPDLTPTSAFGSEEDLVGKICAPGGMRAAPDPEDLRLFVEAASSMDGLRVGELLMQKMDNTNMQVVLRSLYALESVLQIGSSQSCGEVAVMFQSDPGPVVRASGSKQPAVRDRAVRCLKMLLGEDYQHSSQTPDFPPSYNKSYATSQPVADPSPLVDLLGEDLISPPAAAASVHLAPSDPLGELTSGINNTPFQDATTMTSAGHVQQQQYGASVIGTMPASLVAPVAPLVSGVTAPLDDFFSSLSVTAGQSAAPATMTGVSTSGMPHSQYGQVAHQGSWTPSQASYSQASVSSHVSGSSGGLSGINSAVGMQNQVSPPNSHMGGFIPPLTGSGALHSDTLSALPVSGNGTSVLNGVNSVMMLPGQTLNVGLGAAGSVIGTTAPKTASAAPAPWLFPQNLSRQTAPLESPKPTNDNHAFDFVQDHLK